MDLPHNRFKQRLRSGDSQIGFWITIPDPSLVEAMAGAGFDWILLDTEHTPVEVSAILPLLQAAAPYPTSCLVRPVTGDTALIKRHLDQGAQTLILPYIQSRAEAEAAVAAIRYAPAGQRGVAGTMRAAGFGRITDYTRRAEIELCLILQVESALALDRLEDIASVPGVDGIFIGPADLATSMGYPGQSNHPVVRKAILSAIARLRKLAVPSGLLTLDTEFARECIAAGTSFTAVGLDMALFVSAADRLSKEFGCGSLA
jgi:4-hydroxy-2-oxoheptanedioate aldolase